MSSTQTGSAGSAEFISGAHHEPNEKSSAPTNPQSDSGVLVIPEEERPIPTMGLPAIRHKVVTQFRPDARPPEVSKKEKEFLKAEAEKEALRLKAEADEARRAQHYVDSVARLVHLATEVKRGTVAFFGMAGSAATTTTMITAATVMSELTRTILIGSDFNPANGTAAARLGMNYGDTLSIREFRQRLASGSLKDPADLTSLLRPTKHGVRVLSSNDVTLGSSQIEGTTIEEMLSIISRFAEFHYVDTANDTWTPSMRKILEKCDVCVFTANVKERKSLHTLGVTMEVARANGSQFKADNSVVVISNLPDGDDLMTYRKFINRVDLLREEVLTQYDFNGPFLGVQETPALAHNAVLSSLWNLDRDTIQSYIDINIAILEQIKLARGSHLRTVQP